jgi:IS30 family transposase
VPFSTVVLEVSSMSNRLLMSKIHSIETLHQSGHSNREIARLLSVDRGTVNAYVRRLKGQNRPARKQGPRTSRPLPSVHAQ